MDGKRHKSVGILISVIFFFNTKITLFQAIVSVIASRIPDIDLELHIKHRMATHSLLAIFLTTITILILSNSIWFALCWGGNYLSHIFLDMMTPMGVAILYPYRKKYYKL